MSEIKTEKITIYWLIKNNKPATCEHKYFYKDNYIFQNNKKERSDIDLNFCKSLISNLIEDSWVIISASAIKLFCFKYRKKNQTDMYLEKGGVFY